MPQAKLDITVAPLGTPTPSLGDYIAAAEKALQQFPGITFQINPMSTTLSGELDDLLQAVRAMHEAPFGLDAQRVITTIRIDDRRDEPPSGLMDKVERVKQKAGLT